MQKLKNLIRSKLFHLLLQLDAQKIFFHRVCVLSRINKRDRESKKRTTSQKYTRHTTTDTDAMRCIDYNIMENSISSSEGNDDNNVLAARSKMKSSTGLSEKESEGSKTRNDDQNEISI